jgi:ribonuclease E
MAEETSNQTESPDESAVVEESPREAERAEEPAIEASTESADDEKGSETPTAVSLGLIEENFVSRVSTTLKFHAPDISMFPPLPVFEDVQPEDESGNRASRRRRRRGSNDEERHEPRQRVVEVITEPQRIKGSTRLEAKKQRRRDGRDAGRRRSVVTEAEFLARRESVDRQMIVRSKQGRTQIGVLEDGVLVEHYVARAQEASLIGNVYHGRVQNVLPSMEAAFVDIGRGRNAVLYSGEVDWDAVETGNQPRRIELALKQGTRALA